MNVDISVIIPTRNRKESLMDTINSICSGEYIPNEIVIVDQSDEEHREIMSELEKVNQTTITYCYLEKPSLTVARNIGICKAKYNLIICSDDDILVENDTIKNVYNILSNEKDIALIAGINTRGYDLKSNNIQSMIGYGFGRKNLKKKCGHVTKAIFGSYPKSIENRIETEWAMGYFFALKKDILLESGVLWDEKLVSYAYPEDLDFSYRFHRFISSKGMKMILDPKVKVEHCSSQEWRVTSNQKTLMYIINREYLSYKLYPNDISSRFITRWSNIGEFFRRLWINDKPFDVLKAQYICDINRKKIRQGIL